MEPGGRSGGAGKIFPIWACAGGAGEVVVAAIRAARPVRAMVRSISRLLQANRARDIVQTYPPLASYPVNTLNTARKGRLPSSRRTRSWRTGDRMPFLGLI